MSSINDPMNPISSPSIPPAGPSIDSGSQSFQVQGEQEIIDTLEQSFGTFSAEELLSGGQLTIGAFSDFTLIPLDELRSILNQNEIADSAANKKMTANLVDQGNAFLTIYNTIRDIALNEIQLKETQTQQINDFNQAADTYNNQVQATMPYYVGSESSDDYMTDQMNQAISDYNNGAIDDAQFNTIATNYNAYVNSRNVTLAPLVADYNNAFATFNSEVAANNANIDAQNKIRAQYGVPAIPTQDSATVSAFVMPTQSPAPLTIPVASIPDRPVPVDMTPVPPASTPSDLIKQYFVPFQKNQLASLTLSERSRDLVEAFQDYIKFVLKGRNATVPNAFIDKKPPVFFSTQTGGYPGVGGVALATIAAGLGAAPSRTTD